MEPASLSKQIKAFCKEYNLTQQDFAFKSGVGLRFLRELEQGRVFSSYMFCILSNCTIQWERKNQVNGTI